MNATMKAGLLLGLAVEVWTIVVIGFGWHADMNMQALFWMVIVFQAAILVWGMRMTAKEGRTYGGQVIAGLVMSCIGGAIVLVGSYLLVTIVFPDYFMQVQEAGRTALLSEGMSPEEVDRRLQMMASMQTPLMNSIMGAVGTIITGLVLAAIIAAFVKGKPSESPTPSA